MAEKKVLVVDDDPDVVAYVTSFLEDQDYVTRSAGDAARALAVLEGFRPDAILVDVLMPGKSGLDLLVTLRRDPRWQDLPLVVVTGMDQILEKDCQSLLLSHEGIRGPDAVLGKPIDLKALLAVLAYVCDRLPAARDEGRTTPDGCRPSAAGS